MRIQDLHILPKFRDGWSYLYVDHSRTERESKSVAIQAVARVRTDFNDCKLKAISQTPTGAKGERKRSTKK
jgi:hypothetical protein